MHWKNLVDQFATESGINPDLARQEKSLTQFLEQVIARQEEEELLQRLAELPELAARAFDEGDKRAQEKVQQKISELSTAESGRLLRYFTVVYHRMNCP